MLTSPRGRIRIHNPALLHNNNFFSSNDVCSSNCSLLFFVHFHGLIVCRYRITVVFVLLDNARMDDGKLSWWSDSRTTCLWQDEKFHQQTVLIRYSPHHPKGNPAMSQYMAKLWNRKRAREALYHPIALCSIRRQPLG